MTTATRLGRGRLIAAALIVAIAAAVVVLIVHNRRVDDELGRQLYIPRKARITPEATLLQQYIRIDTSNPPGNESAGARWLASQLEAGGVHAEIIDSAPRRSSVYARIRGSQPGEGLILLSHIDVVPVKSSEGWSRPPFAGSIAANMIYGRGSADMKGIGICHLRAFLDVASSGRVPVHDLIFLAVADEESGGELGTRWLIEHRPDVYANARYVLTEGGVTEIQQETLRYFGIEIGAKELTEVRITAPTRVQLQQARLALEPYFRPRDADRVLPGVRSYFRAVAPLRVQFAALLADIDKTIASGKLWLLPVPYRELVQNTVWAGGVEEKGGPPSMKVMMLNLPEEDPDARIAWLSAAIQPSGAVISSVGRKEGPIPMSPVDTPLFAVLQTEVRRRYHGVTVGPEVLSGSTSDSRFLRPRGLVCYGFQPFPLDYFQTMGVHGTNERVQLDSFTTGVDLMRAVVWHYCYPSAKPR